MSQLPHPLLPKQHHLLCLLHSKIRMPVRFRKVLKGRTECQRSLSVFIPAILKATAAQNPPVHNALQNGTHFGKPCGVQPLQLCQPWAVAGGWGALHTDSKASPGIKGRVSSLWTCSRDGSDSGPGIMDGQPEPLPAPYRQRSTKWGKRRAGREACGGTCMHAGAGGARSHRSPARASPAAPRSPCTQPRPQRVSSGTPGWRNAVFNFCRITTSKGKRGEIN